jgi:hypothetical protein
MIQTNKSISENTIDLLSYQTGLAQRKYTYYMHRIAQ